MQAVFRPAAVTHTARLRNNGNWGTRIGGRAKVVQEVIADKATQQIKNAHVGVHRWRNQGLAMEPGLQLQGAPFVNWYNWLPGHLGCLREGPRFVVASLEHWRAHLDPEHSEHVSIRGIDITGSDLHDEGLGALFVEFRKPVSVGPAACTAERDFRAVVKPDEKSLERAVFGDQEDSLANRVNAPAGLQDTDDTQVADGTLTPGIKDQITTFNMKTWANFGSLMELAQANQLNRFGNDRQDANSAMREAMVFAFITGLSDLHHGNVLWRSDGKPQFCRCRQCAQFQASDV